MVKVLFVCHGNTCIISARNREKSIPEGVGRCIAAVLRKFADGL